MTSRMETEDKAAPDPNANGDERQQNSNADGEERQEEAAANGDWDINATGDERQQNSNADGEERQQEADANGENPPPRPPPVKAIRDKDWELLQLDKLTNKTSGRGFRCAKRKYFECRTYASKKSFKEHMLFAPNMYCEIQGNLRLQEHYRS
jgi:hypothetical protein